MCGVVPGSWGGSEMCKAISSLGLGDLLISLAS